MKKIIFYLFLSVLLPCFNVFAMDQLSTTEMEDVSCQSGLSFHIDENNDIFEIRVSFSETPIKSLSQKISSKRIPVNEEENGPTHYEEDAYFEVSGLALNALVSKHVTDENGLNITGTLAFEIPPNTHYHKVDLQEMFFDVFVSDQLNFYLIEDAGNTIVDQQFLKNGKFLIKASPLNIPNSSLGRINLTDISVDITSPDSLYFIYKSDNAWYR